MTSTQQSGLVVVLIYGSPLDEVEWTAFATSLRSGLAEALDVTIEGIGIIGRSKGVKLSIGPLWVYEQFELAGKSAVRNSISVP